MGLPNQGAAAMPGQVIAGRFRIDAELGEGGMAQVYRVSDLATGRTFALKLLKPDIASDAEAVARLRREGEVLAALKSPAVVGIETFGKLDDGRLFLVMDYLRGETLGQRMRREGRIAPTDLAPIVTGAAAGLHAAHEAGIVHRDLKPDNIFLEQTGPDQPLQVRLLDFGISKVYGQQERLTRTGQVLGTPRYMAPEQLSADRDLDARVDIYAFGVILYEALAGSPPFVATTPSDLIVAILHGKVTPLRTLCPQLTPAIEEVVAQAMARAREARFSTALELAEAFLAAVGTGPRQPQRPREPQPRGKRTSVMGGAADAPQPHAPRARPSQPLKIGTFSAGEPLAPPDAEPPLAPGGPVDELQTAAARPAARRPLPADLPGGVADEAPEERALPAEPSAALGSLPTRRRTWLWILVALFAGAATAATALHLWEHSSQRNARDVGAGPSPATAAEPAEPAAEPSPATQRPEAPAPVLESGVDPAPPAGSSQASPERDHGDEPARPAARPARRHSRRGAGRTGRTTHAAAPEAAAEAAAQTAGDVPAPYVAETSETAQASGDLGARAGSAAILAEARAALRAGDAPRCLAILRARPPSSPAALRLEGDCYLRTGDREEAVKAYERLCARDPAAAARVRELVRSLGGVCP